MPARTGLPTVGEVTSPARFFLVERYTPAVTGAAVAAAVQRLAAAGDAAGRHVGTLMIPAEEICLSVFEAVDEGAVVALNEHAGFRVDRIVEVSWFTTPPSGPPANRDTASR